MTKTDAIERLQGLLDDHPNYHGDDPMANHYRRNREALYRAIESLNTKMEIALPPVGGLHAKELEWWCSAQSYLIMVYGSPEEADAAIETANNIADLQEKLDFATKSLKEIQRFYDLDYDYPEERLDSLDTTLSKVFKELNDNG